MLYCFLEVPYICGHLYFPIVRVFQFYQIASIEYCKRKTQAKELHVIDYYVCKYIQNIIVKQASFETDSIGHLNNCAVYTCEQKQVHNLNTCIHIIHTKYICMFSMSLKMEINYKTRS